MTSGLPHTFRPLGVRVAVFLFGGLLVLTAAVIWFTFPQSVRDQFTLFQRSTLVVLSAGFLAVGWGMARSRVEAREAGLRVVNGYRVHELDWNQVLAVTMRPGSPWAVLDLSDGTSVSAVGIQGSDGNRARRQVAELRRLVAEKSATNHDD